jgi:hypothetical protein
MKTRTILRLFISIVTAMVLLSGTVPTSHAAAIYLNSPVVISQLYGGAESLNASYSNDYIELFNRGDSPVNLEGWSLQVSGVGSSRWHPTPLNGTLAPGRYYLVQQGTGNGESDLPTPDAQGIASLDAEGGKVALVRTTDAITEACPEVGVVLADLVGYGDETCAEANPTEEMGATEALIRVGEGCTESDNNANDFTLSVPNPHNLAAPATNCLSPIVLVSYTTHNERDYIDIRWETSFEQETRGFNLYRGTDTTQSPVRINDVEIPAHGGSGQVNRYSYPDYDVEEYVMYFYVLEDIDINGNRNVTSFPGILREPPSSITLQGFEAFPAKIDPTVIFLTGMGITLAAGWVWRRRQ